MPIDFVCPTCNKRMPRDLQIIVPHTEEHIVNAMKKEYPDWVEADGICKKCYDFYKHQMRQDKA